jgi:hypothetical protein
VVGVKKKLAIWRVLNYETMLTGGGGLALYFYFIFKYLSLFFTDRFVYFLTNKFFFEFGGV